jgi:hypothetical protein
MNRRSFLAAVAAIPFVGKLVPPPVPNCAVCDDRLRIYPLPSHPKIWEACKACQRGRELAEWCRRKGVESYNQMRGKTVSQYLREMEP